MISVEFFKPESHYETVAAWWKAQDWPVIPLSHLSQTGILVMSNGKPAACAWLYKSDSALCWLEWIVASPEVRREERASVLSVLLSTAKLLAQTMGFQSIFISIRNQSLAQRLEAQGFKPTEGGMTNYVCDLSRR
jgi:hypothetical protein